MSDVIKDFFVSIGWAVDANSQAKAEKAQDTFEERVTASDRRTTKARLREELIRNTATADTFEKRVKSAERLEQIDEKFGGLMLRRTLRQAVAQAKTSEERIHWLDKLSKAEEAHHVRSISGMQRVANVALTVAATIQAGTVALATFATHAAAKLEALAYAADRTNSSVQELKTFSQAVSQLGGSAGQALNDVESFAARFRSNPQGYTGFFKSVGVEAYDANGKLKSFTQLYKEFRTEVGKKPYEQQLLYAHEMGVSEQTWRATDPAKLAEEEARSRAKYARMGYDPDKAAADAKELQHALRDMFESITIIGEKTASKIFKDIGGNLKEFTTFIEQHGDQIAEILSKVAQVVLEVSKALLQLLTSPTVKQGFDWLLGMFGHVEEGTGKWIADTERIKLALEALAVFVATIFVAKITGAFAAILKELGPLLTRLAPLLALAGLAGLANSNGVLTGPEGSRSLGEGALRTLDPGLADRVYGRTEGDKAADTKDGRSLFRRGVDAVKSGLGLGGGGAPGAGDATPTPAGRFSPLKALIQSHESGSASYNSVYGNGKYGWPDKPVTQMTIKDILAYQRSKRNEVGSSAFPVGRAQFVESTLRRLAKETGTMDEVLTPELQEKFFDRLIRGRGRDVAGLRAEWDSLRHVDADRIMKAYDADGSAQAGGTPSSAGSARKSGWIDADTYTDGLNTFKKGADGNLKRVTNIPGQPATLTDKARDFAGKVVEGAGRLDQGKLRAIGAATEGFDPSQYFKTAPPIGASTTNNDSSVRQQSYKGGDTHVTINTHGDVRETAELWRRHGERQKADDLRHAANIFAV